jgi:hypothetical protein
MHQSFDLYPGYLRHFADTFDPEKPYRLRYDLHAQRNYKKWRDENGKQVVEPQVRHEGTLEISRKEAFDSNGTARLNVNHVREWSTWTDQPAACRQALEATVNFKGDAAGSTLSWEMNYTSVPVLPVKFYRFTELPALRKSGRLEGKQVVISGADGTPPARHTACAPITTLYSLMDSIQGGRIQPGKVDLLDDLTMFRPGLEITRLPDSVNKIEGHKQTLTGYALVGPALLPLYFWMDSASRILAIIGRNVAYTLSEAVNL